MVAIQIGTMMGKHLNLCELVIVDEAFGNFH